MKKLLIPIALAFSFAGTASAQIPVTVTIDIPGKVNHVETITKWTAQYQQLTQQLTQMQQQYAALTGARNLGEIFNDPKLRDYLPQDWQQVYDQVRSGGYGSLSGRGKAIYDAAKVFDSCAVQTQLDVRKLCEAQAVKASQDKGFALEAFDHAKRRLTQIDGLMRTISGTTDPKAIAELQARIGVEQAAIANEQTKLQLYSMVSAAEEKVQQQQRREVEARTWRARGGIEAQPVTFGR